jgi:hypothetical protein
MKAVIQTVAFQLTCVLIFGYVYWIYIDEFAPATISNQKEEKKRDLIDCFYTSVTIQSGVGYYNGLDPVTTRAKLILMLQQVIMICANALIFYLFSIHLLSIHHKK